MGISVKISMKLSRHARNNIKLYQIAEEDILKTIQSPDFTDREGSKTIAVKKIPNKFSNYPLKVVYKKIEKEVFIITAYPLKKKLWR
jgi:hypothetical protein